MKVLWNCWLAGLLALGVPAHAGLLAEGQALRVIPFTLGGGDKPMLAAWVNGMAGRMMFDNGTPDAVFLNRDALTLPPGQALAQGSAASGQTIHVFAHSGVPVVLAGQALSLPKTVRSGDFGFTQAAFGADFLGFVGTPAVQNEAFVLDYEHQQLLVFRTEAQTQRVADEPRATEVRARIDFMYWPGGQPTFSALLGRQPLLVGIDTGDSGTLYASEALRQRLLASGLLQQVGDAWHLHGLQLADADIAPTRVNIVQAGSAQDHRREGHADQLRLGAAFLRDNLVLWNFPARTLTLLTPDGAFLRRLKP